MASSGKRKTTMAKLARERKLMERRLDKQAKKEARKQTAAHQASDSTPGTADQIPQPTIEPAAPNPVIPEPPDA
jgi:hypothetical protein